MNLSNCPEWDVLDIYSYKKLIEYLIDNVDSLDMSILNDLYDHYAFLMDMGVITDLFFKNVDYILDVFISHFMHYPKDYCPIYVDTEGFELAYDCVASFCFYVDALTEGVVDVSSIIFYTLGFYYDF